MKVFISQPMNGRSDEEILKERELIVSQYEENYSTKVEVIDSFGKCPEDQIKGRVYMLGNSISMMHDADLIIFAPNYESAKGCIVEEHVAKLYGFKHMYYLPVSKKFCYGCPALFE